MFEPITGIGFAFGAIGFLVTTIGNVVLTEQKIVECRDRLREFALTLSSCQMKVDSWFNIWGGYSESTYEYLWGLDGIDEVRSRLQAISELYKGIKDLIRLDESHSAMPDTPPSLSRTDRSTWRQFLQRMGENPSYLQPAGTTLPPTLLDRIRFGIYGNTSLKEKIDRLDNLVKGLREDTNERWKRAQRGYTSKDADWKEIKDAVQLRDFVQRVSHFAQTLYMATERDEDSLSWALELRVPDECGDPTLCQNAIDIKLDFAVRLRPVNRASTAARIRLHHVLSEAPENQYLSQKVQAIRIALSTGSINDLDTEEGLKSLPMPSRRSRPLKNILQDSVRQTRSLSPYPYLYDGAQLALGLANWTILLWNTSWIDSPCSCKIRYLIAGDSQKHIFRPRGGHYPSSAQHGEPWSDQKLLLLGVILAEISLASPITLCHDEDRSHPKFLVDNKVLSRDRLLVKVRDNVGWNTLTKAVQYCLAPSLDRMGEGFRPQDLDIYSKRILQP